MKSMFGIEYSALSGLWVSWLFHITGLHPMLKYYALSGQTLGQFHYSTERAIYICDGYRPSLIRIPSTTSPERATYISDRHRPSLISIPFITSPEGATYTIDGHRLSLISIPFIMTPEGAKYTIDGHRPSPNSSEAVSPLANKKREL